MAAEAAGIDFTQLVGRILASAQTRPASERTLRRQAGPLPAES